LRPDNDARPTFLFGAGASFSSGIPLAAESVKRLAKQAYSDLKLGGKALPEQIKTSEWTAWLQAHNWFIRGDDRLARTSRSSFSTSSSRTITASVRCSI
jgi:hypothetical protein